MTTGKRARSEPARPVARRPRSPEEHLQQLRTLVAAANVGLWDWDLESGEVTYSTEWKRQIGYAEHEISNSFSEWEARVHPDDLERTLSVVRAYIDKPWPNYEVEFRFRHKDGSYRWILTQASLALDERGKPMRMLGSHIDITEKKLTESAYRENEARLQAALRVGGIGTLVWELDENQVVWDESLLQLLGRTREELAHRDWEHLLQLVHPEDREATRRALAQALQAEQDCTLECRALRADGKTIWVTAKGHIKRDERSRPGRVVAAVVDITQRRQLEAELVQSQKMEALGQLAGGVAHDFNNLLTVILGQASLLQAQPNLSLHVADALAAIEASARRGAGLTGQLLAFGRRQIGHPQDLDLNIAVSDTVALLHRLVGAHITISFAPWPAPLFVRADPTMLTQVLLNLGVNARDAMERGGCCRLSTSLVSLDEASAASIAGASAGHWACLAVSDTGTGIAPGDLRRLFEPFFTTKGAGKGTGLGLSTVYNILKQHGGFITVETALGLGTTFKVYVPLGPEQRPHQAESDRVSPPGAKRARILLVEDDPSVRSLMLTILSEEGYVLTPAGDAAEAQRLWGERRGEFELLVTDMMMPGGMTGYELATLLCAERPNLRAVLCSGDNLEDIGAKQIQTGGLTLLSKPWSAQQLRRVVHDALAVV